LQTPSAKLSSSATAGDDAVDVGFPVVVKMVHASLAHKSEVGAVALNLNSMAEVERAVAEMQNFVGRLQPDALSDNFLVEKMVEKPVAELLVSVRKDPQFGWAMTLASGGVMTELLADAATLLLPASKSDFSRNLAKLKIDKLLDGFRGGAKGDKDALLDALLKLQDLVMKSENNLSEIEINPLFVMAEGCVVVDALIQQASVA
jgi:acetate---CoA ligase (ADP-forming)